jgi:hypothetical protein
MVPWTKSMPAIHFKVSAWLRQCLSFNLQCSVIDPIGFLCGSVRYVVRFPYVAPQCQFVHWHYPVSCQLVLKQRAQLIDLHFSLFLCESDLFEFFHIGESVKDQHRITSEKNSSLMLSSRSLLRSTASFN